MTGDVSGCVEVQADPLGRWPRTKRPVAAPTPILERSDPYQPADLASKMLRTPTLAGHAEHAADHVVGELNQRLRHVLIVLSSVRMSTLIRTDKTFARVIVLRRSHGLIQADPQRPLLAVLIDEHVTAAVAAHLQRRTVGLPPQLELAMTESLELAT